MAVLQNVNPQTRKELLVTAPRSMQNQAEYAKQYPDGGYDVPFYPVGWLKPFYRDPKYSHNDACGVVDTAGNQFSQASSAYHNTTFTKAVESLEGETVFAHIRAGTDGAIDGPKATRNAQPFTYQGWTFMHNGALGKVPFEPQYEKTIQNQVSNAELSTHDSDSKRIFYLTLARVKKNYGTLNPEQLTAKNIGDIFVDTLLELMVKRGAKPIALALDASSSGLTGTIDTGPVGAYTLFDGRRHYIYQKDSTLYLASKLNDQHQATELMVSSEPVRLPGVVWQAVPDEHLLVVEQKPDGSLKAELTPHKMDDYQLTHQSKTELLRKLLTS